ncbi:MAG TPA: hypothetical protein VGN09_24755 [Vicinamibacteria bacterium]
MPAIAGGRLRRGANQRQAAPSCLSFRGRDLELAMEEEILKVIEPGAVQSAVVAAETLAEHSGERVRAAQLELEQARYEAERCFRQYDASDPENRLVTGELEREMRSRRSSTGKAGCIRPGGSERGGADSTATLPTSRPPASSLRWPRASRTSNPDVRAEQLTLAEAAAQLGICSMTLRRLIGRGLVPASQPVPRVRHVSSEIEVTDKP